MYRAEQTEEAPGRSMNRNNVKKRTGAFLHGCHGNIKTTYKISVQELPHLFLRPAAKTPL